MKKLRIGVAGLNRGATYVKILNAMEGAEVIAICDIDAKHVDEIGASFGVKDHFLESMLEDGIDAVVIATPLHAPPSHLGAAAQYSCPKRSSCSDLVG